MPVAGLLLLIALSVTAWFAAGMPRVEIGGHSIRERDLRCSADSDCVVVPGQCCGEDFAVNRDAAARGVGGQTCRTVCRPIELGVRCVERRCERVVVIR